MFRKSKKNNINSPYKVIIDTVALAFTLKRIFLIYSGYVHKHEDSVGSLSRMQFKYVWKGSRYSVTYWVFSQDFHTRFSFVIHSHIYIYEFLKTAFELRFQCIEKTLWSGLQGIRINKDHNDKTSSTRLVASGIRTTGLKQLDRKRSLHLDSSFWLHEERR